VNAEVVVMLASSASARSCEDVTGISAYTGWYPSSGTVLEIGKSDLLVFDMSAITATLSIVNGLF
jgi:hypothetical protein